MPQATTQTPPSWFVAGSVRTAYVAGVDPNVTMGDGPSGYLKSTKRKIDGFGTLMQQVAPDRYTGRIRVSCYLKTLAVSAWAGLWVRVDKPRGGTPMAFDNMEDRAIKGTTDWTECVVVLDVDRSASNIAFGVLLSGTGTVWIDRLKFEAVDNSVPVTKPSGNQVAQPQNLDFAQSAQPPVPDEQQDAPGHKRKAVGDALKTIIKKATTSSGEMRCSFCHKSADEVKKLIVGGGSNVFICDECVAICVEVIAEQSDASAS